MSRHRYVIVAPTGVPLSWTAADSPRGAIANLLREMIDLWHFAEANGYRVAPLQ